MGKEKERRWEKKKVHDKVEKESQKEKTRIDQKEKMDTKYKEGITPNCFSEKKRTELIK